MDEQDAIEIFQDASPYLTGLAYRLLGTMADAEDVVQDTFLKWLDAREDDIQTPKAWLTTVCTRRCLDVLKSAHKTRVDYVGPWLPEPVHTMTEDTPEDHAELASSLSTAFLMLLERLSPKERAAYLLFEIFDYGYEDVASILDIEQAACRKLVSRARSHVGEDNKRYATPIEKQEQFLSAFQAAIDSGSADKLKGLLSEDVIFHSDGGGKVVAARRPVPGIEKVLNFFNRVLLPAWTNIRFEITEVNGMLSVELRSDDHLHNVITFSYNDSGCVDNIYASRNPDKLRAINESRKGNRALLV